MTDLLIEIGGISRAFFAIGLALAHFAASHLYKAALIKDLFMVQDDSASPHPAFETFMKNLPNKDDPNSPQLKREETEL